jgi:hypothetical protein
MAELGVALVARHFRNLAVVGQTDNVLRVGRILVGRIKIDEPARGLDRLVEIAELVGSEGGHHVGLAGIFRIGMLPVDGLELLAPLRAGARSSCWRGPGCRERRPVRSCRRSFADRACRPWTGRRRQAPRTRQQRLREQSPGRFAFQFRETRSPCSFSRVARRRSAVCVCVHTVSVFARQRRATGMSRFCGNPSIAVNVCPPAICPLLSVSGDDRLREPRGHAPEQRQP